MILIPYTSIHLQSGVVPTGNKEELIPKEGFESFQMHVGWKMLTTD